MEKVLEIDYKNTDWNTYFIRHIGDNTYLVEYWKEAILKIISFPAQSMPAWSTSGGDCGSIMMPGEASNDCTVICGS